MPHSSSKISPSLVQNNRKRRNTRQNFAPLLQFKRPQPSKQRSGNYRQMNHGSRPVLRQCDRRHSKASLFWQVQNVRCGLVITGSECTQLIVADMWRPWLFPTLNYTNEMCMRDRPHGSEVRASSKVLFKAHMTCQLSLQSTGLIGVIRRYT